MTQARPMLLCALLAGCAPVIPAEPPSTSPQPEPASGAEPTPATMAEDPPTLPGGAPLPQRFGGLGGPCAQEDESVVPYCDSKGIAIGLAAPVDSTPGIAWDQIDVIYDQSGLDRGASLKVGLVDEQLWIEHVSCGICRRIMGVSIVAHLDRVSEDQLRQIQDQAGLAAEPLLRTSEDWRLALAPR